MYSANQFRQPNRDGLRQGGSRSRLQSGNRNPITGQINSYQVKFQADQPVYSGIPKSHGPSKGWPARKPDQGSDAIDSKQLPPQKPNKYGQNAINGSHRANSKIREQQDDGIYVALRNQNPSTHGDQTDQSELLSENKMLKEQMEKMQEKMKQMEKQLKEKDNQIQKGRTDLCNLRKKNFEFRQKLTQLQIKAHNEPSSSNNRQNPRNQNEQRDSQIQEAPINDGGEEMARMIQIQRREMMEREKQMVMMTMMNSIMGQDSIQAEEDRLLQQAIEASRVDADPNNPNTDNMTYEQLMELEDRNGKVSKGLTEEQINSIPEFCWMKKGDSNEEACSICFDNFEPYQRVKKLPYCQHEYHVKCIDKWLQNEKRCPVCNEQVV